MMDREAFIRDVLPKIKPRNVKTSDKYSANLYKYLKNDYAKLTVLLYKLDGKYFLVCKNWRDDDWKCITGSSVSAILYGSKTGSYPDEYSGVWGGRNYSDCEEVTDWFWKEYVRVGRCIFDPDHRIYFRDSEKRFTEFRSSRRCNWCGKWFDKRIKKIVRIERSVRWEPVKGTHEK